MRSSEIIEIFKEAKRNGDKIAIAVEGGGLRGVVSAAMLKRFEDLGLTDQVDAVAGTSAGALNIAYFINKNMQDGLNLYKVLASPHFIQPLKWPNAMNLHFLFAEQIRHHFPINWEDIRKNKTSFFVSMTHLKTGQGKFIRAQDTYSDEELLSCVRASASAPLFSTNSECIDRENYNDGQVQHAIPLEILLKKNYDVIFCLLTRKRGYKKSSSIVSSLLESLALKNYSNDYKAEFAKSPYYYNQTLEQIFDAELPKIIPLCLEEEDFIISKMTKKPKDMQKCIDSTLARFT